MWFGDENGDCGGVRVPSVCPCCSDAAREALAEVDGARVEVRRNDTKMELNASETIAAPVSEELDHLAESGPVSVSEVPQLTITKTPSTQSFPDTASPNSNTHRHIKNFNSRSTEWPQILFQILIYVYMWDEAL